MKDECYLIRDILPLYTEKIVSDFTNTFVEKHLEDCPECQKELEAMQRFSIATTIVKDTADITPTTNTAPSADSLSTTDATPTSTTMPLKHLRKMLFRKKLQIILCTAALVLALLTTAFAYLTAPQYLPYTEDMLSLTEHDDGSVTITFSTIVPRVQCRATSVEEYGTPVYFVEAWYTALDRNFDSATSPTTITLTPNSIGKMLIYYSQNGTVTIGDSSDVLLYTSYDEQLSWGVTTLPRLALGYYVILAIFLVVILAVALLIFRKIPSARLWLERIILLPIAYIIGHFCVKGATTISYSMERDFYLIMLVALLIYCGLLCGLGLYRIKRPLIS